MAAADRRQQIIGAATAAILKRGLAQAATRDVTQALGVGSGLLHHYFASWADLRAEAVRTAFAQELQDVEALVVDLAPGAALDRLAVWMVADDDQRHWRLWLNAQDEAHRDAKLAEVMNNALLAWHHLVAKLVAQAASTSTDAAAAAWRLVALMDGLAGAMLVRGSAVNPAMALQLIRAQIRLELAHAQGQA